MIRRLLRIERYPGHEVKLTMDGKECRYVRGKFTPDVIEALFEEPSARDGASMMNMLAGIGLYEELDWLRDHGALAGIVAIMRARRYQIEEGYDAEHDRTEHGDGWLLGAAHNRLQAILDDIGMEAATPASELDEMATAAALAAAEIDRLDGEARRGKS